MSTVPQQPPKIPVPTMDASKQTVKELVANKEGAAKLGTELKSIFNGLSNSMKGVFNTKISTEMLKVQTQSFKDIVSLNTEQVTNAYKQTEILNSLLDSNQKQVDAYNKMLVSMGIIEENSRLSGMEKTVGAGIKDRDVKSKVGENIKPVGSGFLDWLLSLLKPFEPLLIGIVAGFKLLQESVKRFCELIETGLKTIEGVWQKLKEVVTGKATSEIDKIRYQTLEEARAAVAGVKTELEAARLQRTTAREALNSAKSEVTEAKTIASKLEQLNSEYNQWTRFSRSNIEEGNRLRSEITSLEELASAKNVAAASSKLMLAEVELEIAEKAFQTVSTKYGIVAQATENFTTSLRGKIQGFGEALGNKLEPVLKWFKELPFVSTVLSKGSSLVKFLDTVKLSLLSPLTKLLEFLRLPGLAGLLKKIPVLNVIISVINVFMERFDTLSKLFKNGDWGGLVVEAVKDIIAIVIDSITFGFLDLKTIFKTFDNIIADIKEIFSEGKVLSGLGHLFSDVITGFAGALIKGVAHLGLTLARIFGYLGAKVAKFFGFDVGDTGKMIDDWTKNLDEFLDDGIADRTKSEFRLSPQQENEVFKSLKAADDYAASPEGLKFRESVKMMKEYEDRSKRQEMESFGFNTNNMVDSSTHNTFNSTSESPVKISPRTINNY